MHNVPRVLVVGDVPLEAPKGLDTSQVALPTELEDTAPRPDCVVVQHEVGLEAVGTLHDRFPEVPLLYWHDDPDGQVASEATRRGASEYVVPRASETLVDRIRETVARRDATEGTAERRRRDRQALRRFHEVVTDTDEPFEGKLDRLLAVGCEYLGVDIGFLTDVGESQLSMTHVRDPEGRLVAGETVPLEAAYCKRTVEMEGTFALHDAAAAGWAGDPAYEASGLRCYLGGRVLVHGEPGGTLCFADTTPRETPFRESERTFVELVVDWLGSELERRQRETALNGLLDASQRLMGAASRAEIAGLVGRAAADILGYPANAVRLYDPEANLLHPVSVSERTREIMGEREAYPPGEAFTGQVFAAGEPRYVRDGSDLGKGPAFEDVGSLYAHPVGDHGVLTIGSTEAGAIDETDRTLVGILAATAEAAFDRAEREASLRRYRAVYEHTSEMVLVTDPDGTVTLATAPLAERLDETPDALVGGHLRRLFYPEGAERGGTVAEALRQSDDRSRVFETRLRGADGAVPVEVEVSLLPTESERPESCVLVVRDITALERTRTELADERVRFEQLFERSPDAIVDVEFEDGVPVVRAVNDAFEETFGYDTERVVGRELNGFVVPEDDETAARLDERAAAGKHTATEVRRSTESGERDFIFRGVPYEDGGAGNRAFGIYTDITVQKRRERRLLVFDRMLRHNLRNEATAILGFTGELERELEGEQARWAARANAAARNLAESSEHVRWVQRALEGDAPGTPTALGPLVADVLADASEEAPAATLTAEVPERLVVSNGRLLQVALEELVENALQHSDRDSPTVEVVAETTPSANRDTLRLRVRDDGPGIPERERAVLTDEREITQLDHSRGLGLWLARWATQALGGRFEFDETDAVGATVVVEVPVTTGERNGETERSEAGD